MSIVYVGSDHRGYQLRKQVVGVVTDLGYMAEEVGSSEYNPDDDYSEIGLATAEKVVTNKGVGILICSSGVGVSIAANKVRGARAALCMEEKQAQLARSDDDANILCLAADLVDSEENIAIVRVFLETLFSSEERHIRRIKKIKAYESKNS